MGYFLCSLLFLVSLITPIYASNPLQASWYSVESLKKEGTYKWSKGICADGSVFSDNSLTCATRLYKLGTFLVITNPKNNKSVCVKVTDRIGKHFAKSRIDLSKSAFEKIADLSDGVISIQVKEVIK